MGTTTPMLFARFQSTLPVRGATMGRESVLVPLPISIHAPREGSDAGPHQPDRLGAGISIHAPREGSDVGCSSTRSPVFNFNPRSP